MKESITELHIIAPDGYEVDVENSTLTNINFKPIDKRPRTWEELGRISGAYIHSNTDIIPVKNCTLQNNNRNVFPTKEYAEAALALAQLLQLRQAWNGNWNHSYESGEWKYTIRAKDDVLSIGQTNHISRVMTFKTYAIAQEFFTQFKDLLQTAKPLL